MRLAVLSVFEEHFVHVSAGILEETIGAVEDDESNFTVTQHTQLIGLFHQAKLSLGECHLKKSQTGGHRAFRFYEGLAHIILLLRRISNSSQGSTSNFK